MSQCKVVVRKRTHSDELEHGNFKYYKKEPDGKGGWKYYYYKTDKTSSGKVTKFYKKTSGNPDSRYGTYQHGSNGKTETVEVKKSDKWLTSSTKRIDPNTGDSHEVREEGKLDRALDKDIAKAGVKKLKKKTVKAIKSKAGKGKKRIAKLLGTH